MARKPTRPWDPARRLFLRLREHARMIVAHDDTVAKLDDIRPRLQHYLRAMYGDGMLVEPAAPPVKRRWTVRALRSLALMKERMTSESDAQHIRLPQTLPTRRTDIPVADQYRLLAVQHAERMRRGSAKYVRDATSDLERDLFQLAESAAIDAQIVASQPGIQPVLHAARAEAIAQRPKPRWRTEIELRVEEMFRHAWPGVGNEQRNDTELANLPLNDDAESNATWARRTAVALEARYGRKAAQAYRRVPEITLWRTAIHTHLPDEQQRALETEIREQDRAASPGAQKASSRSGMPGPSQSSASANSQGKTPTDSTSDDASTQQQSRDQDTQGEDGDPTGDRNRDVSPEVDSRDGAGETRHGAQRSDRTDGSNPQSAVAHSRDDVDDSELAEGTTYHYPEWDVNAQRFTVAGVTVRSTPPELSSAEWAMATLRDHAREVHRARRQFERLRSHRLRLRRQVQGDELDLEACVEAMVDRRMHVAPSDRVYSLVRPGRRDLAITLLIDVSGSTGEEVAGEQRVIDVERIAALVAGAAFDALGDDYSILAFSSAGASNVRVHTLKAFGEASTSTVHQRIGALAPHGNTRLGAAVRHAAAQLATHPAPLRLLLILSDGKPHDYDWYFPEFAIADSRHAVMDARRQGIYPFCITVDASEGETYLADIFGSAGYRVVSRPSQLSQALLVAVERLIGGAG